MYVYSMLLVYIEWHDISVFPGWNATLEQWWWWWGGSDDDDDDDGKKKH